MHKLTIQFSDNKRFPKKKQSIFEGMAILTSEEQRIMAAKSSETVMITIEGSMIITDGFVGQIPLGEGHGIELLSYLESELCRLYPENKLEVTEFIEELTEAYSEGRNRDLSEAKNGKNSYSTKKIPTKVFVSGIVIFALIAAVAVFFVTQKKIATLRETTTASSINEIKTDSDNKLKTDVKSDSATELGKKYPDQHTKIATLLAEEKQFEKLKDFQKEYPTDEGAFNLAFHEKKWEKVIQIPSATLTNEKQIMLVHAYVELGKLSEAEILNEKLKSKTLTTEIQEAYKRKAILLIQQGKIAEAEGIQGKIKDTDLAELIETGKTCKEMIDFYKKEKDVDNQNVWLKRLENLGGELLDNDSNE
ncbi:hypothetical protein [Enterococcus plantarum]|uniref:hypothetical protein n=1 Tax=Enterococcus plantarum TaxID=1077675 RepID=UPI001A8E4826|nr:hypothetical protein [Enterococcus plantarum]MBO0423381.1 hypothetical protein [Enterococcus plantarum]